MFTRDEMNDDRFLIFKHGVGLVDYSNQDMVSYPLDALRILKFDIEGAILRVKELIDRHFNISGCVIAGGYMLEELVKYTPYNPDRRVGSDVDLFTYSGISPKTVIKETKYSQEIYQLNQSVYTTTIYSEGMDSRKVDIVAKIPIGVASPCIHILSRFDMNVCKIGLYEGELYIIHSAIRSLISNICYLPGVGQPIKAQYLWRYVKYITTKGFIIQSGTQIVVSSENIEKVSGFLRWYDLY